MLDILLLTDFSNLDLVNLKHNIEFHNRQYIILFSDTLKPKHHFLLHYDRILEQSGPLKFLWTFKFESKHRELKSYTKNITSRRNIQLSLALKFCIKFADFILNFDTTSFILGPIKYGLSSSPYYVELPSESLRSATCHKFYIK